MSTLFAQARGMASRRRKRIWTELETKATFDLIDSTKKRLAPISTHAPLHSRIDVAIGRAQMTLTELLRMVSRPGQHRAIRSHIMIH